MLTGGAVAPDAVAQRLEAAGWKRLDDMRGRWGDALSAFTDMVERHRTALAYPGLALIRPGENLWDFLLQQQIMPLFSRPKHDTWEGVARIMDTYPGRQVLYGYVSDDTVEEEIAVERASTSGKYLVPTHQVSNLSFHSAVLGKSPLLPVEERGEAPIPVLDPSKVNVAIAITDGDNLQVPILQYPLPTFWNADRRGSMPLGWSMGVSLSILAPGIWEYYRSTIRPDDEIVSIMGIAYVHASALPEPQRYYGDTFSAMRDAGLHTLWSLDSSLTITDEPLWDVLEKAPAREALSGVLVGYGPSIDKAFRRETGTPVLITQNGYAEDARRIRERIEALLEMDPVERSPVNFLMATNWDTNAEELYQTLEPLEERGVRFWKPSQLLAMMPDIRGLARAVVDAKAPAGTCLPVGAVEQFGSPILSSPTLADINKPLPLPFHVSVEGPEGAARGDSLVFTATVDIPVADLAGVFLKERVLPVIEGYGLSREFTEVAWMRLAASDIRIDVPVPEPLEDGHVLRVDSGNAGATARIADRFLRVRLDSFSSASRSPGSSIRVSVRFALDRPSGATAGPVKLRIDPERVEFDFALTVGIGDEAGPLVGGVKGRMAGGGADPLVVTDVR
jgi:hypothetical protein